MTLDDLCRMAARCTDRHDEFLPTVQADGKTAYTGEAENTFRIFRDAINEAYAEAARFCLPPDCFVSAFLDDRGLLALSALHENVISVRAVFTPDKSRQLRFSFRTRFELEIEDAAPGDEVLVCIHYLPDRLERLTDEPIFPDSLVDPMVYVSLAAARMWQSERKFSAAQSWMGEYYRMLRRIKPTAADRSARRFPRPLFR